VPGQFQRQGGLARLTRAGDEDHFAFKVRSDLIGEIAVDQVDAAILRQICTLPKICLGKFPIQCKFADGLTQPFLA